MLCSRLHTPSLVYNKWLDIRWFSNKVAFIQAYLTWSQAICLESTSLRTSDVQPPRRDGHTPPSMILLYLYPYFEMNGCRTNLLECNEFACYWWQISESPSTTTLLQGFAAGACQYLLINDVPEKHHLASSRFLNTVPRFSKMATCSSLCPRVFCACNIEL